MKNSKALLVILLCGIYVLIFDSFIYDRMKEDVGESVRQIFRFFTRQTLTYQQIRSITLSHALILPQLETAEYTGRVIGEADLLNERFWILKDIETLARMEMSGRVAVSTELTGIVIDTVSTGTPIIHFYLSEPKPRAIYMNKIHSFEYPGSNWQSHHERVVATGNAYIRCLQAAITELRQEALDCGIIERARRNAEDFLRELEQIQYRGENIRVEFHWDQIPEEIRPIQQDSR